MQRLGATLAVVGWRGILPSLGAGTSLIVAGVLCLAIVSSIIAFRGFPGLGPDVARPPLQLVAPAADRDGRDAAPKPIVIGAGPARATLAAPAPRVVRHRARSSERAARTQRGNAPAVSPPITSSPTTPPPSAGSPAKPSPTTSPPAAPSPSKPPAARPRPVSNAVDQVRNVVPAVQLPPVPPAVQPVADEVNQTVDTVSDTVDAAAGVVDDTVGGLLP